MAINIDNSQRALQIPAILRLAFRPLFLGGTLFSIFAIGWWIYFWLDPFSWQPHGGPIWWHGHEMIFGFGVAIVTGFLLTAVQSWTGVIGLRGKPLAALALTWLAGRILVAFKLGLAGWVIAAIDVSFLMGAAVAMAYPIIKVKQWQNLMFIPILTLLAITNATSHWAIL
ncbi:MAG: NnrS family protein, partial [Gammaproteobacteria bacterium]